MGRTIGIDLGTTNSCVCVLDGDDRVVIPNAEGARTTPSVVAFTEDGERLVGQLAKRQAQTNAENTVSAVKRLIGKRYDDEDVQQAMRSVPYSIVESDNGDAWVAARGKEYSPPEISSFVLREMKKVAEDFLGEEVTDAVITVPAYFNDAQRQATKNAGKIAGLNVLRIVNEPTAAALAYGVGKGDAADDQTVAVYDMGGGTFDISILELASGVFSVVSTAGDTFLGGEDFDNVIIDWLADEFEAEHGIDLRDEKMALQRLKEEAERAKCELSTKDETDISLPFIYSDEEGPKHLETNLSRQKLEELVGGLVEESLGPCKQALDDAGLDKSDVDTILLVGGMTRMPLIRQKVSAFFNKEPDASVNPDEVVALGAAVQGSIARGELTDVLLLDVTPLTMGVETAGGVFTPLIPRNTTVPCSHTEVFSTARDNQSMVRVHVLQGERKMAADNKSLAKFELVGIPPAPRGVPKIEVTFSIDENGMVNVRAKDMGSGKEQSVNIVADGGLSDNQIEEMIEQAAQFEEQDRLQKELVEMRNEAQGLLYSTERSFNEFGDALPEDEQQDIANDIATIKDLVEDANKEELEAIIANLEASAYRLAEAMYASEAEDEA
ncbi:molecular chaperone DnaK [Persicimonas caeni]|uniref:Chaperone protein DnaK n=1 Tax=Persicimonas caeni TaxID=2292766 RepID=A0A4Y6Q1K8_PERCE|nr:molecular chaperone DnaK [Persicimonas caeni]QDG54067.1 molecular chaperone DnaK [Persicimonas caeni]QED35288.1 molecular chaperone DnaK [Persicimonas caeni]